LSWWLLALLRSRKVGSDKLTETREITPYLLGASGTRIGEGGSKERNAKGVSIYVDSRP
jgi:hypothetical protein